MIDPLIGVVLLGSNRNRVGSTGRGRCSYSRLISTNRDGNFIYGYGYPWIFDPTGTGMGTKFYPWVVPYLT
jgi:hypothetical protein